MRRTLWLLVACPVTIALTAAPAAAESVTDVYGQLAKERFSGERLVPVYAPPAFTPLDTTLSRARSRTRGGYAVSLTTPAVDGVILLERDRYRSMRTTLRDERRSDPSVRRTRIRGKRGYLFTSKLRPRRWSLAWVEDGHNYVISTGTPRKVSLRQLRRTAEGLEALGGSFFGSAITDQQTGEGVEGSALTTSRTISVDVSWTAPCGGPGGSAVAGRAYAPLLPLRGSAFSFDVGPYLQGSEPLPWSGTVSGTVSSGSVTVNIRATTTYLGQSCDTGPRTVTLTPQR